MKMRIAIAVILAAVAFSTSAQSEQKFQKLTGAQIQAKFPGMELTDEAHWGEVFERNGTLTITSMGHRSVGKWRIQKDQLCLDTGSEPGGGCYEVWLSGRNVELRNQTSTTPLEAVLQKPAQGR
jgi:hypothetical protein